MVCPFCLNPKTYVYNSRQTSRLGAVWRRRRCAHCDRVFTTSERVDMSAALHVLRNNRKERYSKATLLTSILRNCDHRDDKGDAALLLLESIEQKMLPIGIENEGFITPAQIMSVTADTLKNFDAAAYIKYLSQHQAHMSIKDIKRKLQ